jgi:hypothetical protein
MGRPLRRLHPHASRVLRLPLRVRGLDRVWLAADLTILAKLACVLSRARAVPLAAETLRLRALPVLPG